MYRDCILISLVILIMAEASRGGSLGPRQATPAGPPTPAARSPRTPRL